MANCHLYFHCQLNDGTTIKYKKEELFMKKVFRLEDLDCAHCASKMETGIKKIVGVKDASISFMAQKMMIEFDEGVDEEKVMNEVVKVCKKIEPDCVIKR